ncbi:MAG: S24 family peptidase [Campylobacteraceae bacterium]|nr:S24 family peptidase [Campylobacteraceae bacterium]
MLVLTGCGGGGGNNGSNTQSAKTFSVSFYDENISLLAVFNNLEGSIVDVEGNKTLIAGGKWYLENGGGEAEAAYTITNSDLRFYASDGIKTVTTQAELAAINADAATLSGKYILLKDIELDDNETGFDADGWIPIGKYGSKFKGIFNGNNHKITNLWINRLNDSYVGLFGFSENNVQIKRCQFKHNGDCILRSDNKEYGDVLAEAGEWDIIGKVVARLKVGSLFQLK